jgi:hypothetical protein
MAFRNLRLLAVLVALAPAGCATGRVSDYAYSTPVPTKLRACYAYGCRRSAYFPVTQGVADRFAAIMAGGKASPEAERAAVSKAVQYYEDLSVQAIGARDLPKSPVMASGEKGQMDCIDESTNTRTLLLYLEAQHLLAFHKVRPNTSRGILIDGRYPHWTAVLRDPSGKDWAVDSWYEAAGGPPDIMYLADWRTHGVMGER